MADQTEAVETTAGPRSQAARQAEEAYDIVAIGDLPAFLDLYDLELVRVEWPEYSNGVVRPTAIVRKKSIGKGR